MKRLKKEVKVRFKYDVPSTKAKNITRTIPTLFPDMIIEIWKKSPFIKIRSIKIYK